MREIDPSKQIQPPNLSARCGERRSGRRRRGQRRAWHRGCVGRGRDRARRRATLKTLVKVARDIYPHDMLVDSYYITAIKPWDAKAAKDPAVKALLEDGVRRLDQDAQDRHKLAYAQVPWEADRVVLLQGIEHTDFFKQVRSDLVVSLYNQEELWPKFGYEGSSAEHGGYIKRGFNDIDWLPKV